MADEGFSCLLVRTFLQEAAAAATRSCSYLERHVVPAGEALDEAERT